MNSRIDELTNRAAAAMADIDQHEQQWGTDTTTMPAGQAERLARLKTHAARLGNELEVLADRENRVEQVRQAANAPGALIENGFGGAPLTARRADPWAAGSGDDLARLDSPTGLRSRAVDAAAYAQGFDSASRNVLADLVDREDNSGTSALVIAATSDHYRSAFGKILANPNQGHLLWSEPEREAYARVESARASMSLTDANGGYLVPFQLDPSILLTNAGAANPFRQRARVVPTVSRDWNGAISSGVTAEWLPEATEAADASPAFDRLTIHAEKAAAYLVASHELLQDSDIAGQLGSLIQDAKDRLESAAFTTGNGTNSPYGLVSSVAAVTASRVSPTTAGTFGSQADVYKALDGLPARARQSAKLTWIANNSIISKIRQLDTYGGSSFWADLRDGTPASLLGAPIYESSAMASTVTTGSDVLLAGNFEDYLIADRLGTTLYQVPMVVGANRRPTFQAGWAVSWRVGAKVSNPDSFRVLRL